MLRTKIAGIGMYVPKQVVSNNDLTKYMDTNDTRVLKKEGMPNVLMKLPPLWALRLQR